MISLAGALRVSPLAFRANSQWRGARRVTTWGCENPVDFAPTKWVKHWDLAIFPAEMRIWIDLAHEQMSILQGKMWFSMEKIWSVTEFQQQDTPPLKIGQVQPQDWSSTHFQSDSNSIWSLDSGEMDDSEPYKSLKIDPSTWRSTSNFDNYPPVNIEVDAEHPPFHADQIMFLVFLRWFCTFFGFHSWYDWSPGRP